MYSWFVWSVPTLWAEHIYNASNPEENGDDKKILFELYNRSSIQTPIETYVDREEDFYHEFDPNKKTIIIIGGWEPISNSRSTIYLKSVYLKQYDCNLILVSWLAAATPNYLVAIVRMTNAALRISEFIDKLVATYNIKLKDLHVVGHSLGAHVCGIAAYNVKSGKVGRVTGLDPVASHINLTNPNESLGPNSAQLVVVLHTSFWGVLKPIGHVNFYANRGTSPQPGCFLGDLILTFCSHYRAYKLYGEAITDPNGFEGLSCDSYHHFETGVCRNGDKLFMNETIPLTAQGTYYFFTKSSSPYAEGPI